MKSARRYNAGEFEADPRNPRDDLDGQRVTNEIRRSRSFWAGPQPSLSAGALVILVFTLMAVVGDRHGYLLRFVERAEYALLDAGYRARGALEPSEQGALVMIDQPTIERYGRFPLPRGVIGEALAALARAGARQVVVDMVFCEPASEQEDAALTNALAEAGLPVYLGHFFYTGPSEVTPSLPLERRDAFVRLTEDLPTSLGADHHLLSAHAFHPSLPVLQRHAAGAGFLNVRVDEGGIVRRAQLVIAHDGRIYPSIEVLAAADRLIGPGGSGSTLFLGGGARAPVLHLGDREFALDPSGAAVLDYVGPAGTFPTVSLLDVLDGGDGAASAEVVEAVHDRTVLLGTSAVGVWDRRDTPFTASVPSVEIHAAIIDNILEQRFIQRPPWIQVAEWLVMLVVGLLLTLATTWAPVRWCAAALVGLVVGLIALDLGVLFRAGIWFKPIWIAAELIAVFGAVLPLRSYAQTLLNRREREQRQHLLQLFGKYVSPAVIDQMLADPSLVRLGGERRDVSLMFSDLRGFTSLSEHLAPQALSALLNDYFGAMTEAILEQGGMLDKFMGDGIMALFGAPLSCDDHAARACRAALDKVRALQLLNERLSATATLDAPLRIGIGINSGGAVVGNMGSVQRFEYTAIGDEVNLASRLEGVTKQYGVCCVVSDSTRAAAGADFVFRELDLVRVLGRQEPVRVHELVGYADERERPWVAVYERALARFRDRCWDEARTLCGEVSTLRPGDGPARLLAERAHRYAEHPPGEDWDGCHILSSK